MIACTGWQECLHEPEKLEVDRTCKRNYELIWRGMVYWLKDAEIFDTPLEFFDSLSDSFESCIHQLIATN